MNKKTTKAPEGGMPTMSQEILEYFRETGRQGGKIGGKRAAANITQKQRTARAKKAAAASARVRTEKAKQKRKGS